jgi:hypothetical protein
VSDFSFMDSWVPSSGVSKVSWPKIHSLTPALVVDFFPGYLCASRHGQWFDTISCSFVRSPGLVILLVGNMDST